MSAEGAAGEAAAQYEVVGPSCAIRREPCIRCEPVGDISTGTLLWGQPVAVDGAAWVRLSEKDSCRYVPAKAERKNGCWVNEVHPTRGKILEAVVANDGAAGSAAAAGAGGASARRVALKVKNAYETALEFDWQVQADGADGRGAAPGPYLATLEMVVGDTAMRDTSAGLVPAQGAVLKHVEVGRGTKATVRNIASGQGVLASVILSDGDGGTLRSPWVRTKTLSEAGRKCGGGVTDLWGMDPSGQARARCQSCPCEVYVPVSRGSDGISAFFNCRRCACHADCHERSKDGEIRPRTAEEELKMLRKIEVQEAEKQRADEFEGELHAKLRTIEAEAREKLEGMVRQLPREALEWDRRECYLWFWSDGLLHPRENRHAARRRCPNPGGEEGLQRELEAAARAAAGELDACGLASVVAPTTQDRQGFHRQLWECFVGQAWPAKELIVVETYWDTPSEFFSQLDGTDDRLVYLSFRVKKKWDLSVGAKRNLGHLVATGDYIVNFDDDDLYAPAYIKTMVTTMESSHADMITLSAWHVFDRQVGQFGLCDPLAWAELKGMTRKDPEIDGWLWGYGFSYVYRLDPALDADIAYPNISMSEDLEFVKALQRHCGRDRAALLRDEEGMCLHILHGANQSSSFCVREVAWGDTADLGFMAHFEAYFAKLRRLSQPSQCIIYPSDKGSASGAE